MTQCISIKKQTGDYLIESLIGMVLMAIVGMGLVQVSSRASVAQKDMRYQEIAVNQMRALLIQNKMGAVDICANAQSISLPNGESVAVQTQGCNETTTATIGGTPIATIPKPISLRVDSALLGGKIDVGGTWQVVQ